MSAITLTNENLNILSSTRHQDHWEALSCNNRYRVCLKLGWAPHFARTLGRASWYGLDAAARRVIYRDYLIPQIGA